MPMYFSFLIVQVVTLDYSRIVELSEKPLHNAFNEALRGLALY
jgi:dTDP-glucose pyrophosphorylase